MGNKTNPLQKAVTENIGSDDKVLLGVLNWGLGHATRCIPLIKELKNNASKVIIASDGVTLEILRQQFPELEFLNLPSYKVSYAYKSAILNFLLLSPNFLKASFQEYFMVKKYVHSNQISIVISDNRFGFWAKGVKNIYISHQLNILHKNKFVSQIATKIHEKIISKFEQCWIPDFDDKDNLSGDLSSNTSIRNRVYLGPLTRIRKVKMAIQYDIFILLSGPEPQRSILEEKLLSIFQNGTLRILMVRGSEKELNFKLTTNHIKVIDLANSSEVENALNSSRILITRSGYSTLMDINELDLKTIFIPTPGQTEQEYLAEKMKSKPNYDSIDQKSVEMIHDRVNKLLRLN